MNRLAKVTAATGLLLLPHATCDESLSLATSTQHIPHDLIPHEDSDGHQDEEHHLEGHQLRGRFDYDDEDSSLPTFYAEAEDSEDVFIDDYGKLAAGTGGVAVGVDPGVLIPTLTCPDGFQMDRGRCLGYEPVVAQYKCPHGYVLTPSNQCEGYSKFDPYVECPPGFQPTKLNTCSRESYAEAIIACPRNYEVNESGQCVKYAFQKGQLRSEYHVDFVEKTLRCPDDYTLLDSQVCERLTVGPAISREKVLTQLAPFETTCPTGFDLFRIENGVECRKTEILTPKIIDLKVEEFYDPIALCPAPFVLKDGVCQTRVYVEKITTTKDIYEHVPSVLSCPEDYVLIEGECETRRSFDRVVQTTQTTVYPVCNGAGTNEPCVVPNALQCGDGFAFIGGQCLREDTLCPNGVAFVNGKCIANTLVCPVGTTENLDNGLCEKFFVLPPDISCPIGADLFEGANCRVYSGQDVIDSCPLTAVEELVEDPDLPDETLCVQWSATTDPAITAQIAYECPIEGATLERDGATNICVKKTIVQNASCPEKDAVNPNIVTSLLEGGRCIVTTRQEVNNSCSSNVQSLVGFLLPTAPPPSPNPPFHSKMESVGKVRKVAAGCEFQYKEVTFECPPGTTLQMDEARPEISQCTSIDRIPAEFSCPATYLEYFPDAPIAHSPHMIARDPSLAMYASNDSMDPFIEGYALDTNGEGASALGATGEELQAVIPYLGAEVIGDGALEAVVANEAGNADASAANTELGIVATDAASDAAAAAVAAAAGNAGANPAGLNGAAPPAGFNAAAIPEMSGAAFDGMPYPPREALKVQDVAVKGKRDAFFEVEGYCFKEILLKQMQCKRNAILDVQEGTCLIVRSARQKYICPKGFTGTKNPTVCATNEVVSGNLTCPPESMLDPATLSCIRRSVMDPISRRCPRTIGTMVDGKDNCVRPISTPIIQTCPTNYTLKRELCYPYFQPMKPPKVRFYGSDK